MMRSEVIDVENSKLHAVTYNFDNDVRYLGKKINRFELVDQVSNISDEEPKEEYANSRSPLFSIDDISYDALSADEIKNDVLSTDNVVYDVNTVMDDKGERLDLRDKKDIDSSISAQLELDDALLSCLMLEQEMVTSVNRLPQPLNFKQITASLGNLYNKQLYKTKREVKILLRELLKMQHLLLRLKEDEDEDREDEEEKEECEGQMVAANQIDSTLQLRHSNFEKIRNRILLDSSNRVNFFIPLSSRKSSISQPADILTQITQMMSVKMRFVEKTQVQRSLCRIIGKTQDQSRVELNADRLIDAEIFDDNDFYHQMLVEMTRKKTSNLKDMMVVSRYWCEISKIKKRKKNIDPKASKGRRTRYTIHKKLANFMAPMPNAKFFSDNQRNSLYVELSRTKKQMNNEINWMFKCD